MVDADLGDVLGIFVHGPMRMPGAFVIVPEGFWRRVKGMSLRVESPLYQILSYRTIYA